jgi:hypothetical protein
MITARGKCLIPIFTSYDEEMPEEKEIIHALKRYETLKTCAAEKILETYGF